MSGFVGRVGDLAQLDGCLTEAALGRGALVVARGEAGIGKTRLCEELATLAVERGFKVAWAACSEFAGVPAFWPWSQLLGQLGRKLPEPAASAPGEQDADSARLASFERVAVVLREEARAGPRLLVLDDLHWADDATVRLLAYVAPFLRTIGVLLVTTLRAESGLPGPGLLTDIERQARVLLLDGLDVAEVRRLLEQGRTEGVSKQAVEAIRDLTAGNPLFMLEVLAQVGPDLRAVTDGDLFEVPRNMREIQVRRLNQIGADCRSILDLAAVIGQTFDVGLLALVLDRTPTEILVVVDEAISHGMVREVAPGRLSFSHPLLAAVLYEELGVARRARAHERVGLVLEKAAEPDVAALAHHFLGAAAGGTADRAVRYASAAGARAMAALAYGDAARLYERALGALDLAPDAGDRIGLLLALAEARAADGLATSRDALLAAADRARAEGRAVDLAAVALGLAGGRGFEIGLFDEIQIEILEEALAGLPEDAGVLRSLCSSRLSVALSLTSAEVRRAELSDEAVRLARSTGDLPALAQALAASCDVHAGPDATGQRLCDADEIISSARETGDRYAELLGRRIRLVALLEAGELSKVGEEITRFARIADLLGQPVHGWYVPLWHGMYAASAGDFDGAARFSVDAESVGQRAQSFNASILVFTQRFFCAREAAAHDRAAQLMAESFDPEFVHDLGIMGAGAIALAHLGVGRHTAAAALFDRWSGQFAEIPVDSEWLPLMVQFAEVVWELGSHPTASWLYDTLLPYADCWAVEGIGAYTHGPAARHLGMLAAVLDRPVEAAAHFAAALEANRAAGAQVLLARTRRDAGLALGDDAMLREALADYTAMAVVERIAELTAILEARTQRPEATTQPLTATQLPSAVLRREGDLWVAEFEGSVAHVRDSKGIRDLARLIAEPGREIPALDLAVGPSAAVLAPAEAALGVPGDLGELIDAPARAAYKARLVEIEAELDEADGGGDSAVSERLLVERDALVAQLTGAYGLGGRVRRTGDPAERARTSVTARIRDAIRRIDQVHPAFGRHLSRSVRTGTFCTYDP